MSPYELIDFAQGRKLESLQGYVIDRPCPAAAGTQRRCAARVWEAADAVFLAAQRRWDLRRPWPEGLALQTERFFLPFRATAFGHIGCFPEQAPNWRWLQGQVDRRLAAGGPPPQGLNLFAHTGGSTLAMASSGAQVTHVDAAKPSVTAARQAAAANGLAAAPIRYLVEDAARYVARELRRKHCYDLVVLDPPSYGHAPGGKPWRIQRDLWPLLEGCLRLLRGPGAAMLITGHSSDPDPHRVAAYLREQRVGSRQGQRLQLEIGRSELFDRGGRPLDAGFFVRATW